MNWRSLDFFKEFSTSYRFVSCCALQLACRVFLQGLGGLESLKRTWAVSRLFLIASLVLLHFPNDQNRNKAELIDFKESLPVRFSN